MRIRSRAIPGPERFDLRRSREIWSAAAVGTDDQGQEYPCPIWAVPKSCAHKEQGHSWPWAF